MGAVLRPEILILLLVVLPPWILGFTVVRADADHHGQPGWLWAVLTLPLGWIAILGYVVVRALLPQGSALNR